MTDKLNYVDNARDALSALPESADSHDVLAAVHRRLMLDRDVRSAEQVADSRLASPSKSGTSWWFESLGCIVPALLIPAFFIAMPLLFSVGERILSRPARTSASGTIVKLDLIDGGNVDSLIGRSCRVTADHLLIESSNGSLTVIPNESVLILELDEDDG